MLCKILIWNQVWSNSEYIFREGVSTAVQEGNLISSVELGWLVLQSCSSAESSCKVLARKMRPDPKPVGIHTKRCLITWSFFLWSQGDVDIYFNRRSSSMLLISSRMYFSRVATPANQSRIKTVSEHTNPKVRNENIKYLWNKALGALRTQDESNEDF